LIGLFSPNPIRKSLAKLTFAHSKPSIVVSFFDVAKNDDKKINQETQSTD